MKNKPASKIFSIFLLAINCYGIYVQDDTENELYQENTYTQDPIEEDAVCESYECITIANQLIKNINNNVEPCDDFYNYACGNFIETHDVPEDENHISSTMLADYELDGKLKRLLDRMAGRMSLLRPFELLKQFYNSCMSRNVKEDIDYFDQFDNDSRNDDGNDVAFNYLKRLINIEQNWPVLNDEWVDEFDWMDKILELLQFGFHMDYFMKISIERFPYKSNEYFIILDLPTFIYPQMYTNENGFALVTRTMYYNHMMDVAAIFGANKTKRTLQDGFVFESKIADAHSYYHRNNRNDPEYLTRTTLDDLMKMSPNINYMKLLNNYFGPYMKFDLDQTIIVYGIGYFRTLNRIIGDGNAKSMANFIYWKTVSQSLPYLSGTFYTVDNGFLNTATNRNRNKPLWKNCLTITREQLPIAVGAYYAQTIYKNPIDITYFHYMIEHLKRTFQDETKVHFKTIAGEVIDDKIDSIFLDLGFPDEFYDNNTLAEYYDNLIIDDKNFLASVLHIQEFNKINTIVLLWNPHYDHERWTERNHYLSNKPVYNIRKNSLKIAQHILDGRYFSVNIPNYFNYGALGTMIAHELFYTLNQREGALYDMGGYFQPWRVNGYYEDILEEQQCLIQHYTDLIDKSYSKFMMDARETLFENLADIVGVSVAYVAYNSTVKEHQVTSGLTGYTSNQLFWLSYANQFCTKFKEDERYIDNGIYAPAPFRVLGPLRSLTSFANDFHCSNHSKMFPSIIECEFS